MKPHRLTLCILAAASILLTGSVLGYDEPVEKKVFTLPSYTTIGGRTLQDVKVVSYSDSVRVHKALVDSLGIRKLQAVAGASDGSTQAMEWAAL